MSGGSIRAAVEARDLAALGALLADDVVFRSPVAHKPYVGKAVTAAILANVIEVFEDFRYVRELRDGTGHALVFEAEVDGLSDGRPVRRDPGAGRRERRPGGR